MNDIRFNGHWFPMDMSQNRESNAADNLARSQNTAEGCASNMCNNGMSGVTCVRGLQCIDLWRHAECRLKEASSLTFKVMSMESVKDYTLFTARRQC